MALNLRLAMRGITTFLLAGTAFAGQASDDVAAPHDHAAHMAAMQAAQAADPAEAGVPHDHAAHMAAMQAAAEAKAAAAKSRWDGDYFPNIPLVDQDGNQLNFFDDVIKDKVVAINFIFTSCTDSCPLETARLREVRQILGDRVGKDVFFYSISIDPETDTPEVLKAYSEKYDTGPGWRFLTGDKDEIILLRKRLGLYLEDIAKDSTDHNLSLIIGNQSTGRWMKSSPFENPHILATQLGSWLHNWKNPKSGRNDYAKAPELRRLTRGEELFRTRCSSCHSFGAETGSIASLRSIGPDLKGVTDRRERTWLVRWLSEPDRMIAEKDPIATALLAEYRNVMMPNLRLSDVDVVALLEFMRDESARVVARADH